MDADREAILKALSEGLSLRKACAAQGVPPSNILYWCDKDPVFAEQYARARDVGYRLLADELVDISDDGQNDTYEDDEGNVRTNQDVIARSRLRVDTRKWMLSKMLPKLYGEKTVIQGDPDAPLVFQKLKRTLVDPKKVSSSDTEGK
jgi:hypothetical protein